MGREDLLPGFPGSAEIPVPAGRRRHGKTHGVGAVRAGVREEVEALLHGLALVSRLRRARDEGRPTGGRASAAPACSSSTSFGFCRWTPTAPGWSSRSPKTPTRPNRCDHDEPRVQQVGLGLAMTRWRPPSSTA